MDYRDVKKSPADLDAMMAACEGGRRVPVIVENGRVTVGYGGT